MMNKRIGKIIHVYQRIGVAVVCLEEPVQVGDTILILGHTTDLVQEITSMEVNHTKILSAGCGAVIAIQVDQPVRKGDEVFWISREEAEKHLMSEKIAFSPGG